MNERDTVDRHTSTVALARWVPARASQLSRKKRSRLPPAAPLSTHGPRARAWPLPASVTLSLQRASAPHGFCFRAPIPFPPMFATVAALLLASLAAPATAQAPTGAAALWGNKYQGDVSVVGVGRERRRATGAERRARASGPRERKRGPRHRPPAASSRGGHPLACVGAGVSGRWSAWRAREGSVFSRFCARPLRARAPASPRPLASFHARSSPHPLSHAPSFNPPHPHQGTYYGDWGGQGACSYQFSNTVKEPWSDGIALRVAMNSRQVRERERVWCVRVGCEAGSYAHVVLFTLPPPSPISGPTPRCAACACASKASTRALAVSGT